MHARKQKALAALMASPTVAQAAKVAGISERTMYRYMDDDEFATAYKDAMKRISDETAARLIRSMGPAVNTLDEIAKDGRASPHARVQAANSILSHGMRALERRVIDTSGPMPTFTYSREAVTAPTFTFEEEANGPTIYLGVEPKRRGLPAPISDEARARIDELFGFEDNRSRAHPRHTLEDADRIHAQLREGKYQDRERTEDGQES